MGKPKRNAKGSGKNKVRRLDGTTKLIRRTHVKPPPPTSRLGIANAFAKQIFPKKHARATKIVKNYAVSKGKQAYNYLSGGK